jgi:phage gp16-like protein
MFKIERVEWLDDVQLNKLVAALAIDKKRRAARSGDNGRA